MMKSKHAIKSKNLMSLLRNQNYCTWMFWRRLWTSNHISSYVARFVLTTMLQRQCLSSDDRNLIRIMWPLYNLNVAKKLTLFSALWNLVWHLWECLVGLAYRQPEWLFSWVWELQTWWKKRWRFDVIINCYNAKCSVKRSYNHPTDIEIESWNFSSTKLDWSS